METENKIEMQQKGDVREQSESFVNPGMVSFANHTQTFSGLNLSSRREELSPYGSIISKTSYRRVKPELKKFCPGEWGRFLDNHYHPEIHNRPFGVSTKYPDE